MSDVPERLSAALAGRYEIERELGQGGMASVYLAEDHKHGRKVAVKVLRPEIAAVIGAERFLAEIRTTANLQHPHILPLFDSGEADGYLYYVMPFIDGETLAERLHRERQLGVDDAVRIAREVADALEHAHRSGVIHRDIKPGNILLQNGRPMVADFGIALAVSEAGAGRMTETGLSLGTPHYMSPEQASADRDLTARSDVYSLGCVLYEMLAGQPPHTGPSAQSILVRILTETPAPLTELRHTVPEHVAAAVAKAIEKLPADRFDSPGDFAAALANVGFRYQAARGAPGAQATGAASSRWLSQTASKAAVAAIAVLAVALGATLARGRGESADEARPSPAVVRWPLDSTWLTAQFNVWEISRDGSAVVIRSEEGQLTYVRLDGSPPRVLVTDRAQFPVFSPDGAVIAYSGNDGGVFRVSVDGGSPEELDIGSPFGLPSDWGRDGYLYYSTFDGMYRKREQDPPEKLLDESFVSARFARVLPGGDAIVYTYGPIDTREAEVRLLDLETRAVTTLVQGGFDAWYAASGHLIYGRFDRAIVAAPFDLTTRAVGRAVVVMDSVSTIPQLAMNSLRLAETGTATYARGGSVPPDPAEERSLARVDMAGGVTIEPLEPGPLSEVAVSPDGRSVAYANRSGVRLYDMVTGRDTRFSQMFGVMGPRWSSDGARLSYAALGGGGTTFSAVIGASDGTGPQTTLETGWASTMVTDFAPDGSRLLVQAQTSAERPMFDLYILDADGGNPVPYLQAQWSETDGHVSRDGAWAAYVSDQSGSSMVYLRSFPEPGLPVQISEGTASDPRWGPDGTTLFYASPDSVYAAILSFDGGATVTSRRALFARGGEHGRLHTWDVHPDGGFVGTIEPPSRESEAAEADEVVRPRGYLVVNWLEEIRRRMGGAPR